jgi:hypothetical protein
VSIVPVELDGVLAYWSCPDNFDGRLAIDRKRVLSSLDDGRRITASGAGAAFPKISVGVSGFVAIVPAKKDAAWSGKLDRFRDEVHTK